MFCDCCYAMQPVEPMFVSSCTSIVISVIFLPSAVKCTVLWWSFLCFILNTFVTYLVFSLLCFTLFTKYLN